MLKKRLTWVVLLPLVVSCSAQNVCSPAPFPKGLPPVTALLGELRQIKVENLEELVPPEVADKLTQLKDALSRTSDAALSCAKPSVDPVELQKSLAQVLHAIRTGTRREHLRFKSLPGLRRDIGIVR